MCKPTIALFSPVFDMVIKAQIYETQKALKDKAKTANE
jgi:hypothetical protein